MEYHYTVSFTVDEAQLGETAFDVINDVQLRPKPTGNRIEKRLKVRVLNSGPREQRLMTDFEAWRRLCLFENCSQISRARSEGIIYPSGKPQRWTRDQNRGWPNLTGSAYIENSPSLACQLTRFPPRETVKPAETTTMPQ